MNDDVTRRRIMAEGGAVLAGCHGLLLVGSAALWAVSAAQDSPNCGQLTCTGWDRIEVALMLLGLPFGVIGLLLSTSALFWFARWRQVRGAAAGGYAFLIGLAPAATLALLPVIGGLAGAITQSR